MHNSELYRRQELLEYLRIKSTALHDRVKNKTMVSPLNFGGKLSVYPKQEVDAITAAYSLNYSEKQIQELVASLEEKRTESAQAFLKQLKMEGKL
ncbi:hypothetical protein [Alteromonas sp. W364]|uniref:hypothetical protein n=1 Tax=Alteromonas sp. W364 TaxID=3075610 RepID=UPI002884119D|nr:hypothetical protein [Alteromonas sp. W364]MDT0626888.1 hypothetical protein [Alteromonas sp. W364]